MKKKYNNLSSEELLIIREKIKLIFNGVSPLKGVSPFNGDTHMEIIAEWFRVGDSDFEDRIKEVIKSNNLNSFLILDCNFDSGLEITNGYKISIEATNKDLYELCHEEFMFCIKGTECMFLDESFSWVVLPLIDIQLVYGDNAFFKKYYLNESDKLKAVNDVKEFFAEWNLKKSYQAISKYLNFRINGKLICGEIYYPQIDNNEN